MSRIQSYDQLYQDSMVPITYVKPKVIRLLFIYYKYKVYIHYIVLMETRVLSVGIVTTLALELCLHA